VAGAAVRAPGTPARAGDSRDAVTQINAELLDRRWPFSPRVCRLSSCLQRSNVWIVSVLLVRITAEAARRFLVARHFLAPAQSLEGGLDAVLEVFRKLGSIQFDPLAVAGRNHDLVLHGRVAGYEPGWCDELYERRQIFEAYNKGLSLVPSSEFPWFRGVLTRKAPRVLAENAEVAERVLERIRTEGPLSALDFERDATATAAPTTCSNGCYRPACSRTTRR
jgi:hypothetical protein